MPDTNSEYESTSYPSSGSYIFIDSNNHSVMKSGTIKSKKDSQRERASTLMRNSENFPKEGNQRSSE